MSPVRWAFAVLVASAVAAVAAPDSSGAPGAWGPPKPRIVVLTDISPPTVEPDDLESLVRLLVSADLFEIEGLVATTGWSTSGNTAHWTNLIHAAIGAYEKDLPNLRRRSGQEGHLADESRQRIGYWPSPDYLRSRTVVGSQTRGMRFVGKDNDSAGSELLVRLADEADDRPVWVLGWGGANTLAQAIWRVRSERSPERFRAFLRRLRVYAITDQDRGYERGTPFDISSHQWLRREFSDDLRFLWDESAWTYQNGTGKANWDRYAAEIQGHGHLGAMYPKYRYGVEGDTPSFLYLWPNGLNEPEEPGHVGWGGFFARGTGPDGVTQAYVNQPGSPGHAVSRKYEGRFYPAIFADFVARMQWAKSGRGNRNPIVTVNGEEGLAPVRLQPAPGTTLVLDASVSRDPETNALHFAWWVLPEAGTYAGELRVTGGDSSRASVEVPAEAEGTRIHLICEVTDDGVPPLTSYRRIVLEPRNPSRAK